LILIASAHAEGKISACSEPSADHSQRQAGKPNEFNKSKAAESLEPIGQRLRVYDQLERAIRFMERSELSKQCPGRNRLPSARPRLRSAERIGGGE
jgi:hypothetical protein